ncbi:uncharacterized protein LOC129922896 [Biomphalaria glabrata]|uniref:Uncharacterized protein LOC129922896 n=1 Tax=Biomphalaria glabrata TaxID=6526 RepID=A0A9W2YWF0_BIOGL|nr:uncharacterized protein LOC129922896 [Biomphalaria glabrata]
MFSSRTGCAMSQVISLALSLILLVDNSETVTLDSFQLKIYTSEKSEIIHLHSHLQDTFYINKSESIQLTCSASGYSIYVALLKDNREIKREFVKDGVTSNVSVQYVKTQMDCTDAGKYTCRAGNHREWPSITKTVLVKCPVLPIKFRSSNVNKMKGATDLVFVCDNDEDQQTSSPKISIKKLDGAILKADRAPSINFTFPPLSCQDMGTYYCDTQTSKRKIDLFVHNCSPVLSPTEAVLTTKIGKSLTLSVNVTMSKKVSAVSVYYQTHKQKTKLCGPKLCVKEKLNKNWRRLITIKIANITDQDIGNQTVQICSRKGAELLCSNLSLKVVLSENRPIKTKAKVPSLNVNQTSVTRLSTSLPGFKVQKVHTHKFRKEKLKKKETKKKEQRNKLKQKEQKKRKVVN